MSAPAVWQLAALLVGVTVFTLIAAGVTFAIAEWVAMRREGKAGHDA